jgi:hypothetical protein
MYGAERAAATSPAWAGEFVSARTSSGVASSETPLPSAETTCPLQSRRKSGLAISRVERDGAASVAFRATTCA